VSDDVVQRRLAVRALSWRAQALIAAVVLAAVGAAAVVVPKLRSSIAERTETIAPATPAKANPNEFYPTKEQWATLTIEAAESRIFRPEQSADGKITLDDDRNTPIFSPYSGRVIKLLAQAGDRVEKGQVLFTVEATDMVQAQNDLLAAAGALNTARSQLRLAQITEKRQHDLYDAKAVALKDWQQSQSDLVAAQNGERTAEVAIEAVRNRLRILGKPDQEIAAFEKNGRISAATPISAPIAGTVVQRKVGPGQFLNSGATDPAFVIGDVSKVWLVANVRESDAPKMRLGDPVEVKIFAFPDRVFGAKITYVATAIDPATRRLTVRAEVDNAELLLKPEMYASFNIVTGDATPGLAVPRNAIVYEGDSARVWVAKDDGGIELRQIKAGLTKGDKVQVLAGLEPGEKIVTKGTLFIDRAATGDES